MNQGIRASYNIGALSSYPKLTKEEMEYFIYWRSNDTVGKILKHKMPLWRSIAMALNSLATSKVLGVRGFSINKEEGKAHHLKACCYEPEAIYKHPKIRKDLGLIVHMTQEEMRTMHEN